MSGYFQLKGFADIYTAGDWFFYPTSNSFLKNSPPLLRQFWQLGTCPSRMRKVTQHPNPRNDCRPIFTSGEARWSKARNVWSAPWRIIKGCSLVACFFFYFLFLHTIQLRHELAWLNLLCCIVRYSIHWAMDYNFEVRGQLRLHEPRLHPWQLQWHVTTQATPAGVKS